MDMQTHGFGAIAFLLMLCAAVLAWPAPAAAGDTWSPVDAIIHIHPDIDQEWAAELGDLIASEFEAVDVDPLFGVALCYTESSFRPKALNSASGCKGLFQIHPIHGELSSFDPEVNVNAGALIFKRYLDRADGDYLAALKRYGQGKARHTTMKLYRQLVALRDEARSQEA